jgi:hypothetical protein
LPFFPLVVLVVVVFAEGFTFPIPVSLTGPAATTVTTGVREMRI